MKKFSAKTMFYVGLTVTEMVIALTAIFFMMVFIYKSGVIF
jgi:hypothetical protein